MKIQTGRRKTACPGYWKQEDPDPRKASLGKGDYVDYYITKFWVALENSYKNGNIQRTEVTFPGSSHVGLDGDMVTVEKVTVTNHDFGDLANLLSLY